MIVRSTQGVARLITQPDHAALAGRIMERWRPLAEEPRRGSILLAVAEHDNGWREPDADPTLDADGRIADFVHAAREIRQGVWPRGIARLAYDPWAAALVAQHAITVYDRFRPDPRWTTFFAEMEASRDARVADARGTLDELENDYVYVRLGDLISLTFCTGWEDVQAYARWRVRLEGGQRVIVSPSDLEEPELAIGVDAIELPDQPFPSREALHKALDAAPRARLEGVVTGESIDAG